MYRNYSLSVNYDKTSTMSIQVNNITFITFSLHSDTIWSQLNGIEISIFFPLKSICFFIEDYFLAKLDVLPLSYWNVLFFIL